MRGRALVACPTYAGKEYALDAWTAAFNALTYPDKHAYQVDNTRVSMAYFERLKKSGIDVTHVRPWPDWDRTFKKCWDLILKRAQELDCYWVYSVEADNVPAPESLDVMITAALLTNVHLVTHAYPQHNVKDEISFYYHELGCMLMTRSLLERALSEFEEHGQIVVSIFSTNDRYNGGWVKMTNRFEVKHLDGYDTAIPNLAPSNIPGLMYPNPGDMPAVIGNVLPACLQEGA